MNLSQALDSTVAEWIAFLGVAGTFGLVAALMVGAICTVIVVLAGIHAAVRSLTRWFRAAGEELS